MYDNTGRLAQLTNENLVAYCFNYDPMNRLNVEIGFDNRETVYHYYGSGHLSAIKFNDRLITDITRDKLHREVSRTQGKLVTAFKLDAIGRLEEQLATLEQQTAQTTQQALVNRYYRYDETGNLIQSRDLRMGNQDYYYDKLGQLTMTGNEVFAFDPAHNLIERESEKRLNNQLHEYQGVTYHYDEFGNLSQRKRNNGEVQTYSYNARDRLIKAVIQRPNQKAETWHYQYDVLGRRMIKVRSKNGEFLSETKTQFIWDGSHLVQEINHKTDRTFSYIYSHPNSYEPLAQICTGYKGEGTQSETNAQHIHYFHCDQIGAPREMTDEAGNLLWYADYKGWGGIREAHNLKDAHQPFRLQNQYIDEETGLHYNLFRYYDPHIGRFTQQDPIGLAGGNNLYRFEGTVQNQVDPFGLDTYMCTRGLGKPSGSWSPIVFNHTYLCTGNSPDNMYCSSTTQYVKTSVADSVFPVKARPTTSKEDSYSASRCTKVSTDSCVESCVTKKLKNPLTRRDYAIGPAGEDCQEYSDRVLTECRRACNAETEMIFPTL